MPLSVKVFPGEAKWGEGRLSHWIDETFWQQVWYKEVQEKSIANLQAYLLLVERGYPFLLLLPFLSSQQNPAFPAFKEDWRSVDLQELFEAFHQPHGMISHWVGNLSIMQIALVGLPHGYCVNQSNKIPLVINILFIISSVKNPTNTVSLSVNWPLKTTWSVNLKKVGGNT